MLLPLVLAKNAFAVLAIVAAPSLAGWSPPSDNPPAQTIWTCPTKPDLFLQLTETRTSNGPTYVFEEIDDGHVHTVRDIDSPLMADYLGIGTLPQRTYKWIGSRLFLSAHDHGIGILDLAQARFVFNNNCPDYVPLSRDRFVVLAERAIPRHGVFDYAAYRDTLYLVDPAHLHLDSPSQDPARHVARRLSLSGLLASHLLKTLNPDHLGAFLFHDSHLDFIVLDASKLKILRTLSLPGPLPPATQSAIENGGLDDTLPGAFPDVVEKAD
jgi:hypothetical protein